MKFDHDDVSNDNIDNSDGFDGNYDNDDGTDDDNNIIKNEEEYYDGNYDNNSDDDNDGNYDNNNSDTDNDANDNDDDDKDIVKNEEDYDDDENDDNNDNDNDHDNDNDVIIKNEEESYNDEHNIMNDHNHSYYYYEQIGAPTLLYRNIGSYTIHDEIMDHHSTLSLSNSEYLKYFCQTYQKNLSEKKNNEIDDENNNDNNNNDDNTNRIISVRKTKYNKLKRYLDNRNVGSGGISGYDVIGSTYHFIKSIQSLYQTYSRYYYPMDYNQIRPSILQSNLLSNKRFHKFFIHSNNWTNDLPIWIKSLSSNNKNNTTSYDIRTLRIHHHDNDDDNKPLRKRIMNPNNEDDEEESLQHQTRKRIKTTTSTNHNSSNTSLATSDKQDDDDESDQQSFNWLVDANSQALHETNMSQDNSIGQNPDKVTTDVLLSMNEIDQIIQSRLDRVNNTNIHYQNDENALFDIHLQQINEKRAIMLYDSCIIKKQLQSKLRHTIQGRHQLNEVYRMTQMVHHDHHTFDSNYYIPCQCRNRIQQNKKLRRPSKKLTTKNDDDNASTNDSIGGSIIGEEPSISEKRLHQTFMYERERINYSDTSYLAPFHHNVDLLEMSLDDYHTIRQPNTYNNSQQQQQHDTTTTNNRAIKEDPYQHDQSTISIHDYHSPMKYGNCIVIIPCACSYCINQQNVMLQQKCILHPVGPLLDHVKVSYLSLPNNKMTTKTKTSSGSKIFDADGSSSHYMNVDSVIRQLIQCGGCENDITIGSIHNMFIARTDIHYTIFRIEFGKSTNRRLRSKDTSCLNIAHIIKLYCIDLRIISSVQSPYAKITTPSYIPVDMTSHPKYGNKTLGGTMLTDCNIAIVYQNNITKDQNTIHHVFVNENSMETIGEHTIRNLQSISYIDFTSHHPMMLWSASQSYIRPTLSTNMIYQSSRIGHGTSLYSIDLRTNIGTFQWSPSHEGYMPDGIHSISGIKTDWDNEYCLWVSSISAGKTWEIDVRMPFRVVTSWSLPYAATSDEVGLTHVSPHGLYGAGTLFWKQPSYYHKKSTTNTDDRHRLDYAMCSVGKTPNTYSFHMYNRPQSHPILDTDHIECVAHPNLYNTFGNKSKYLATSSIFVLPDISSDIFTCGIGGFRCPVNAFVDNVNDIGYNNNMELNELLVVVTMTNKGDLYTQTLAASKSNETKSTSFDGLPLGCSVVPVKEECTTPTERNDVRSPYKLSVSLSNTFPVPSKAIHHSQSTIGSSFQSDAIYLPRWDNELKTSDDGDSLNNDIVDDDDDDSMIDVRNNNVGFGSDNYMKMGKDPESEAQSSSNLLLRKSLLVNPEYEISKTMDRYILQESIVEKNMYESEQCRSDITSSLLQSAWRDDDDSNTSSDDDDVYDGNMD